MKPMKDKKTPEEMGDTDKFRAMLLKTQGAEDDTGKYLTAVISALVLGIGGLALILWIRPEYDPILVAGIIFAFLTPTTTSLLSFMKAEDVKAQSKETYHMVNSRMSEMIEKVELLAHERGLREGRDAANERTDDLARKKEK